MKREPKHDFCMNGGSLWFELHQSSHLVLTGDFDQVENIQLLSKSLVLTRSFVFSFCVKENAISSSWRFRITTL